MAVALTLGLHRLARAAAATALGDLALLLVAPARPRPRDRARPRLRRVAACCRGSRSTLGAVRARRLGRGRGARATASPSAARQRLPLRLRRRSLASATRRCRCAAAIVSFHEGLAFLAQVVLFIVLGLLVFPSRLGPSRWSALALTAVLVFVARPLAVWRLLAPFRFAPREQIFLSWAGLRGAVPIVLATFALSRARRRQRHDLQHRLLRRRRVDARPGHDARAVRPPARPHDRGSALLQPARRDRRDPGARRRHARVRGRAG